MAAAADYSIGLNVRAADVRVGSKGDIATELKSARLADTRQDAEGAEGFPDSGSVEAITPYGTSVINGLPFSTTRVARAFTRDVPLLMPSWILLASMYNESPAL